MVYKSTDDQEAAIKIGRNIEILLRDNHLSQVDLSKAIGVSESAVGKWISGKNAPTMGNVQKIATHLGVPMSYIMEGKPAALNRRPQKNSSERKYLLDKIATATDEDIQKLAKLWDIITEEEDRYF